MRKILFFVLLLEGFITVSIEILAIRQLVPFFGSSIIVTSMVIGIFLLFLALGYWRGGLHARDFFRQISLNFSRSFLWIGLGLSYTFIAWFYLLINLKLGVPYLLSLSLYLFIVLAPISFWLGQTIPLTTNLFHKNLGISRISGRALFLSTLGSFSGAILTSLIFFQFFGVAWAVFINCALLFGLILYLQTYSKFSLLSLAGLSLALIFIFEFNVTMEKTHFILTNNYANYHISATQDFSKTLYINNSASSQIGPEDKAFPYIEYLQDLLFNQLKLRHKKILVIGAGGFSFSAKGDHENEITYVDIDPAQKELAEKHFLEQAIQGSFIGQDARQVLLRQSQHYDVIISDAYSYQNSIPAHLVTVEYFRQLARHLKPSGLLIVNAIANPFFADRYSQRLHQTLTTVFPFCHSIPLSWVSKMTNILYICSANSQKTGIYTDNLNPSEFDFFNMHSL